MTEYWVSQGNKWCDFCKIYIANNSASIRTHEAGQRHKDNVAKRLNDIRKENVSKEKERQQAFKDMERIEAQARRSYQKDLAAQERITASAATTTATQASDVNSGDLDASSNGEWVYDEQSSYFYNAAVGCYHDSKSGLYYSESLGTVYPIVIGCFVSFILTVLIWTGKWTSQQEALKDSVHMPDKGGSLITSAKAGRPPRVLNDSKSFMPIKGKASSLEVGKRKRKERPALISKEEADALKAREAAKKRVQEREKGLLGLYQS